MFYVSVHSLSQLPTCQGRRGCSPHQGGVLRNSGGTNLSNTEEGRETSLENHTYPVRQNRTEQNTYEMKMGMKEKGRAS